MSKERVAKCGVDRVPGSTHAGGFVGCIGFEQVMRYSTAIAYVLCMARPAKELIRTPEREELGARRRRERKINKRSRRECVRFASGCTFVVVFAKWTPVESASPFSCFPRLVLFETAQTGVQFNSMLAS